MKKTILMYLLATVGVASNAFSQEVVRIYEGTVPNSKTKPASINETFASGMYRNVIEPSLEVYLPEKEKATGSAVVIIPGGGYSVIVFNGEGVSAAKQMANKGVAAFVLKYRLPNDTLQVERKLAPLQDAVTAMKWVKSKASQYGLDSSKIGVMGFSAGGHLAASLATQYNSVKTEQFSNISAKPAFQILVYPVVSMLDSLTHKDSKKQLIGANASQQDVHFFSGEKNVDKNTPPAYLTHAADDNVVDVDNSIFYFEQLRKNKVPVEMHIYPKGGHGFIFRQTSWTDPLFLWMKANKWLKD